MEIHLEKLAAFEEQYPHAQHTLSLINDSLRAYINTPEVEAEILEPLFPIFNSLEKLGIVTDAPELEDEEGDGNSEEDEEEED